MTSNKTFVENIKSIGCINIIEVNRMKLKDVANSDLFKKEDKLDSNRVTTERKQTLNMLAFLDCLEKATNEFKQV